MRKQQCAEHARAPHALRPWRQQLKYPLPHPPPRHAWALGVRCAGMTKLSSTLAIESKAYSSRAKDLHRQVWVHTVQLGQAGRGWGHGRACLMAQSARGRVVRAACAGIRVLLLPKSAPAGPWLALCLAINARFLSRPAPPPFHPSCASTVVQLCAAQCSPPSPPSPHLRAAHHPFRTCSPLVCCSPPLPRPTPIAVQALIRKYAPFAIVLLVVVLVFYFRRLLF